jgi:hypothetical protein
MILLINILLWIWITLFILGVYYRLCITQITHQQLWGYKVEDNLHLRGTRTKMAVTFFALIAGRPAALYSLVLIAVRGWDDLRSTVWLEALGQLKNTLFMNLFLSSATDRLCGQSSWLHIQRSGFDSRRYQIFWEVVGPERGQLCLVSTTEELLERRSSGSGLESREYGRRDTSSWPCISLYPQKLALTSSTSGDRTVGIVRSRTQATEFNFFFLVSVLQLIRCRWSTSWNSCVFHLKMANKGRKCSANKYK